MFDLFSQGIFQNLCFHAKRLLLFALVPIPVGLYPGAAQQLHALRVLRADVNQGAADVVEDLGEGGEARVRHR